MLVLHGLQDGNGKKVVGNYMLITSKKALKMRVWYKLLFAVFGINVLYLLLKNFQTTTPSEFIGILFCLSLISLFWTNHTIINEHGFTNYIFGIWIKNRYYGFKKVRSWDTIYIKLFKHGGLPALAIDKEGYARLWWVFTANYRYNLIRIGQFGMHRVDREEDKEFLRKLIKEDTQKGNAINN